MKHHFCSEALERQPWCIAIALMFITLPVAAFPPAAQKSDTTATEKTAQATGSVFFSSEDGVRLHALYSPGKDKGMGAVLIHMAGRSSQDWRRFAERLGKNGIHAVALDLRGHGKSTSFPDDKTTTYEQLKDEDFPAMTKDIAAAVNFLRTQTTVDPDKIMLIGASLGANLAIRYAADDPRISNVLLLSPGLEYKGVTAENAVQRYGDRPLFIAVSREDNFSAKSSLVLDALCKGKKYLKIYTGAGHGTKMMSREPSLEPTLYSWISGTLATEDDAYQVGPPSRPKTP